MADENFGNQFECYGDQTYSLLETQETKELGQHFKSAQMAAFKAVLAISVALFRKDDEDNTTRDAYLLSIANKFSQILGELASIRSALDEVKLKLEVIEAKLDDLPFQIELTKARAVQDLINEEFSYWASQKDDSVRAAANDARTRLILSNRALMKSGKFSYTFDLSISFLYELGMSFLLEVPETTVDNAAKYMSNYLDSATNPRNQGSLGDTLRVAEMSLNRLLEWEENLERKSASVPVKVYTEGMTHWGECTFDQYQEITGDLESGLKLRTRRINARDCRTGGYGSNGDGKPPFTTPIDKVRALRLEKSRLVKQSVLDKNREIYLEQKRLFQEVSEILPIILTVKDLIEKRVKFQLNFTGD